MQTYSALGKVEGNLSSTLIEPQQPTAEKFAAAIEYARDMDSYAFLVWHRGELALEQYFGDFDENLRPETASMHKSVLALLLMAAVEDSFIKSLTDPIGLYIDEWRDRPEGEISITHLLNMSSGLKPLDSEGGENSPRLRFLFDGENARESILGLRQEVAAGSRFLYANTNSQLLALVLESATKMPYAQYLSKRLWQPIGADDAYVWYNEVETLSFPRTYSALLARPRDWLRVGLLIKDNGKSNGNSILKPASIEELTEPSTVNENYAKHIWLGNDFETARFYNDKKEGVSIASTQPFLANDMIYFDGFGGQRVYISREHDLVVVRVGDIRFDWDDAHLPNLVIKALKQ